MNTCEKCKHWKEIDDPNARGIGYCHGLSLNSPFRDSIPELAGQIKGAMPEIKTKHCFSCAYFEAKPQDPFFVYPTPRGHCVAHMVGGKMQQVCFDYYEDSAKATRDVLNKLWKANGRA